MNGFGDVLRGLDWTVPIQILLSVIPALICITLHECAHGYAARCRRLCARDRARPVCGR